MSELYYEKDFISEIVSIEEKNGAYHIVLEHTAFFPGNDHFPCDQGLIEDCPVTSVYEEGKKMIHVSSKKPIKIHKVKCHIDWQKRFEAMQSYTAYYLTASYLYTHCNLSPTSYKLASQGFSLSLNTPLLAPQLSAIETGVNEMISQMLPLQSLSPTKQELKKLAIRKPVPKMTDSLRLIALGDEDYTVCEGLHLRSSIEVQALKLTKAEKTKSGFTLHFLVGQKALNDLFSMGQEETSKIQELTKEYQRLTTECQKLKGIINDYKAKEIIDGAQTLGNCQVIKATYEELSPRELQSLANKMVAGDNVIALLGLKTEDTAYLMFMCSKNIKKLSMNRLLKDSITLLDGQGGGTDFSAQGGGKSLNNLESALDYAFMQVKNKLTT